MNEIYSMELQYESLIPIDRPKKTFLSVGTVTFLVGGDELPLDFNITEGSVKGNAGSIICVNAEIKDFEPEVFMDEYRELGLSPSDLNYDFFAKHYQDTYLAEVYSEYFYTDTPKEIYLPLTLKSAVLLFQDGSVLDYSDRISVFAQKQRRLLNEKPKANHKMFRMRLLQRISSCWKHTDRIYLHPSRSGLPQKLFP